ncbi:MAG: hypothetical protein KAH32_00990 [Chlamydiia bacterium]|nr:hypothetical protein [Chlamydiia bacterium]
MQDITKVNSFAKETEDILLCISKELKVNIHNISTISIDSALSFEDFLCDVRVFIKQLSKHIYNNINLIKSSKLENIYKNIKKLFSKIDDFHTKVLKGGNVKYENQVYEFISLLGFLKNFFEAKGCKNSRLLTSLAMEWHTEINRYNILEKPDMILHDRCSEFIFFSQDNAERFFNSMKSNGISDFISRSVFEHRIMPKRSRIIEDSKIALLSMDILRRLEGIKKHVVFEGGLERWLMCFRICANLDNRKILHIGAISDLFMKNLKDVRSYMNAYLFRSKEKCNLATIAVLDCICFDIFNSEWLPWNDKYIRSILSTSSDIVNSTILHHSSKKKKISGEDVVALIINVEKFIDKLLLDKVSVHVLDIINTADASESGCFDFTVYGAKGLPYVDKRFSASNKLVFIHNFIPYRQYSEFCVEMMPEYIWFLLRNTEKHLIICLDSTDVWHHKGRVKAAKCFNSRYASSDLLVLNIEVASKEYLYSAYSIDSSFNSFVNSLTSEFLSKGYVTDIDAEDIGAICNLLVSDKEDKDDISISRRMFIIDFIVAVLIVKSLKRNNVDSMSIIENATKDAACAVYFFVKSIIMLINMGDAKSRKGIVRGLIELYIHEMLMKPLSVNGLMHDGIFPERAKNFLKSIINIVNYNESTLKEILDMI